MTVHSVTITIELYSLIICIYCHNFLPSVFRHVHVYIYIIYINRKQGKIRWAKLLRFSRFSRHRKSFPVNIYLYYTSFI